MRRNIRLYQSRACASGSAWRLSYHSLLHRTLWSEAEDRGRRPFFVFSRVICTLAYPVASCLHLHRQNPDKASLLPLPYSLRGGGHADQRTGMTSLLLAFSAATRPSVLALVGACAVGCVVPVKATSRLFSHSVLRSRRVPTRRCRTGRRFSHHSPSQCFPAISRFSLSREMC